MLGLLFSSRTLHTRWPRDWSSDVCSSDLVLDATTGQNALSQAKVFSEATNVSGIVLTKLDGTAKGGIVLAIRNELHLPVKFIGLGEQIEDLRPFDAHAFVYGLFADLLEEQ